MKIAIFLDVDKTLTRNNIQHDFAKALSCETEYLDIENRFQAGTISSPRFAEELIALFASKQFTAMKASSLYDCVILESWADEILKKDGFDRFLVSSGPSYYIDNLAKNYFIPPKNVLRSEYRFAKSSGLIESCDAVGNQQKHDFVQSHVHKYDITIGVGDSPRYDTFLSLCTIPLLTAKTDDYLYMASFGLAVSLVDRISKIGGDGHGIVELDKLSPIEALRRLSISSWVILGGAVVAAFGAGAWIGK